MDHRAEAWYRRRTSQWLDWPLAELLERKQRGGIRISVVIPARNEERTVAGVVGPLVRALVSGAQLVDELVVIDSDSTDATGEVAAAAGATVHRARDIAPGLRSYPGKGEALWKSLLVTQGDVLHDLAVMAAELLAVAERRRAGPERPIPGLTLEQYHRQDGQVLTRSRPVPTYERPPARSVLAAWSPGPLRVTT